jgi:hypothetical protein
MKCEGKCGTNRFLGAVNYDVSLPSLRGTKFISLAVGVATKFPFGFITSKQGELVKQLKIRSARLP